MSNLKIFIRWFAGFFEDDTAQSMTRLCTLILVISGVVYAMIHQDYIGGGAIASIGITGKLIQKRGEKKTILKSS